MSHQPAGREPFWRRYLRFFGPDVARDVDDELTLHFDLRVQDYIRRGLSPEAARLRVQQEFGDIDGARRECRAIDEQQLRDTRRADWLDGLRRDAVYGLRRALRNPGFSLVAILTLALGLGATTAIFSVVHGVLLRPLPFPEPERLVRLYEIAPTGEAQNPVSAGNYADWLARSTSFAALGGHHWPYQAAVSGGSGDPLMVVLDDLTLEALTVLESRPRLGRLFGPDDVAGDGSPVVLVSYRFWRDRFGGDPAVLGKMLQIDERPHEIIGVMPADFDFPFGSVDLWRPVAKNDLDTSNRRSHNLAVIARLKPGVELDQARAEMSAIAASLGREHPEFMEGWGVNVVPIHADLVAPVRPLLLVLLAGIGLVLVIACGNVANLLLARAVGREREIAVRGALGAGRGRVVRQLLMEGVVLAGAAAVLGVVAGRVMLTFLLSLAPPDIPLLDEVRLDRTAFAFAGLLTIGTTLIFALLPALRLAGTDLLTSLRSERAGGGASTRLRAALVLLEVALSVMLLIGAGLLIRSFLKLQRVDLGFRDDRTLALAMSPPSARFREIEPQVVFYDRLLERLRSVPGVAMLTSTSGTPADPSGTTFSFSIEGRTAPNPSGRFDPVWVELVTPGYFGGLAIPVIAGRGIEDTDRAGAVPVAVLNQSLARQLWPGENPIGQRIAIRSDGPRYEIVGIVGDTRFYGADHEPPPVLYLAFAQKVWSWFRWQTVLIRPEDGLPASALVPPLREAIREFDAQLVLPEFTTVEELFARSTARRRFATVLLGGFAGAALLLGVIGVYGVLSTMVAHRRQELAIRVALGADHRRVVGLVLRHAVMLTLAGVALGTVGAVAATRLLGSLLFGVVPVDPITFGGVAGLLIVISVVTALVPAIRAARVDPVSAMKS